MKNGNLIVACGLEGFGIWLIIDSYRLGLQTFRNPGSGLFPFLLGILLCLLALPIFISSLKDWGRVNIKREGEGIEYQVNLGRIGAVVACIISYYLLFEILGFLIASFLFLLGLFWIGNPRQWKLVSLLSVATVGAAYLVFNVILKIPLPLGILK